MRSSFGKQEKEDYKPEDQIQGVFAVLLFL
jgi:hypothetical protein